MAAIRSQHKGVPELGTGRFVKPPTNRAAARLGGFPAANCAMNTTRFRPESLRQVACTTALRRQDQP
jgi:hypothetical protein